MRINPILNTDSYKASHFLQYPPDVTHVNSYIEARPVEGISEVVCFGLQMYILEYLANTQICARDIDEAEEFFKLHGEPFNRVGWEIIIDEFTGFLPVRIEALPEGTVVEPGTPMVQIVNTDSRFPWLPSYLETALLRAVWYPSTVATNSRAVKKMIWQALLKTSDDPAGQIAFKLHDFGARGVSSYEQAGIGGCAHLVNFMGTDTIAGALYACKYYGEGMAGFSIPAAEHSTMTAWGKNREVEAYRNMLTAYPTGLVAVVSDSYDIYNAINNIWGRELREEVLARDGVVVIRPDSGDPQEMVMFALDNLYESFGGTTNSKGFKVLNPKVRIIQGDGVDKNSIKDIIGAMIDWGWSMDNVAFGMGAGLLQHVNRDTLRFAMKASAVRDDNGWRGVQKTPKSDPGKASKKGVQHVIQLPGSKNFLTMATDRPESILGEQLQSVYEMHPGWTAPRISTDTFSEVRKRAGV